MWCVDLGDAAIRELVRAVIARRIGMAAHPVPADPMMRAQRVELAPEIRVLDRLAVARAPAVLLPRVDPALDSLLHVLGIEVEVDVAGPRQRLERPDDGRELHPVVRRLPLAAKDFLLALAGYQKRTPAARARVALARAVGINDDLTAAEAGGHVVAQRRRCVVRPSRAPAAGASAFLRRSRRCHVGVMSR